MTAITVTSELDVMQRALRLRSDRAGARARAWGAATIAGGCGMSGVFRDAGELIDA